MESFEREFRKLKEKSFAEISALPPHSVIEAASTDKKHTISLYRDVLEDGSIQVVLQSYRYRFLGMSAMHADGLKFEPDGTVSKVSEEELWDFT